MEVHAPRHEALEELYLACQATTALDAGGDWKTRASRAPARREWTCPVGQATWAC